MISRSIYSNMTLTGFSTSLQLHVAIHVWFLNLSDNKFKNDCTHLVRYALLSGQMPYYLTLVICHRSTVEWIWYVSALVNCSRLHMSCSDLQLGRVKRIYVFEHSVMTNFNCACPAIQRGQGTGFLSEGSSWLTACMSEQRRSGETARMRRLA